MDTATNSISADQKIVSQIDAELAQLQAQVDLLKEKRKTTISSIDNKLNDDVIDADTRSVNEVADTLNAIYTTKDWNSNDHKVLLAWGYSIDPSFRYCGDAFSQNGVSMYPVFMVNLPDIITDDTIRNISFLAQVVSTIHPARIKIEQEYTNEFGSDRFLDFVGTDGKTVIEKYTWKNGQPEPLRNALLRLAQ